MQADATGKKYVYQALDELDKNHRGKDQPDFFFIYFIFFLLTEIFITTTSLTTLSLQNLRLQKITIKN